MRGPHPGAPPYLDQHQQCYVVAVEDPALILEARAFLANGPALPEIPPTTVLVPVITVAAGSSPENLNYADPANSAWPWHATSLLRWEHYDPYGFHPAVVLPELHSRPSDLSELLDRGTSTVSLVYYPLVRELDLAKPTNVVNLSTRGWVDAGERVLIGGFIIEGGTPRWVFIRARGPSLTAFGIEEPLTDPRLTLFRGSEVIATNNSWRDSILGMLFPSFPTFAPPPAEFAWMVPGDDREPVFWVSLMPGAYTVHVSSETGAPGVALIELFDLDVRTAP